MRRVLMIHYNFPPLGGVASVRAVRLARYLPEFGWTPVIITPRESAYHEDRTLTPRDQEVWHTGSLEWALTVKKMFAARNGANGCPSAHPNSGGFRTFVHRLLYIPDAQIGWYPFALRSARAALRSGGADVVFSSSPPVTGHLVGRKLSRDNGLPWVAEFRDLWTDWSWNGRWRQPIDRRIERSLLGSATAAVTVSPTYERVLYERGARRVVTVTNGFDVEDFRADSSGLDDVLAYVGTYYPQTQDLGSALRAFASLIERGLLRGFRFRIIGDGLEQLLPLIRSAGIESRVDSSGFVSHEESLRLLARSRVLLLAGPIASRDPALRGNVAGKTFEYLASRRPILYVGDLDSDIAAMLRPYPHVHFVECGDDKAAEAVLEALVAEPPATMADGFNDFSHRELASRLAAVLSEVAG